MNDNETMEVGRIKEMVLQYESLRTQAEEAKAVLEDLNKQKDAAEKAVIMALLDMAEKTGIDDLSVKVDNRKYSAKTKEYFSIPKTEQDAAFRLLRELGHGDLITERVDDRTLSKELAEVIDAFRKENPESTEEFPEEYGPLLSHLNRYTKESLGRVMAR